MLDSSEQKRHWLWLKRKFLQGIRNQGMKEIMSSDVFLCTIITQNMSHDIFDDLRVWLKSNPDLLQLRWTTEPLPRMAIQLMFQPTTAWFRSPSTRNQLQLPHQTLGNPSRRDLAIFFRQPWHTFPNFIDFRRGAVCHWIITTRRPGLGFPISEVS